VKTAELYHDQFELLYISKFRYDESRRIEWINLSYEFKPEGPRYRTVD
jgi:hypothetical protein